MSVRSSVGHGKRRRKVGTLQDGAIRRSGSLPSSSIDGLPNIVADLKGLIEAVRPRLTEAEANQFQSLLECLKNISERIMGNSEFRAARLAAGMTQEAMAAALHRTARQIARYESGMTPIPIDIVDAVRRLVKSAKEDGS